MEEQDVGLPGPRTDDLCGDAKSAATELRALHAKGQADVGVIQTSERKLLKSADYFYSLGHWEVTCNDMGELSEFCDLNSEYGGDVIKVGRLKELRAAWAVNLPVSYADDGEPDEWEVVVFRTEAAAKKAYRRAMRLSKAIAKAAAALAKAEGRA